MGEGAVRDERTHSLAIPIKRNLRPIRHRRGDRGNDGRRQFRQISQACCSRCNQSSSYACISMSLTRHALALMYAIPLV